MAMSHAAATNLKVFGVIVGTLALFTFVSNSIPQLSSEVPEELTFGADVSPEELAAAGEDLFNGAGGCVACHGLGERAPNLLTDHAGEGTIGSRCATRVAGEDCKTYLHESMVNPAAFVVSGFDPIMPDMTRTLSPTQIWAVVAYLESAGGTVTVSGEDLALASEAEASMPAGGMGGPSTTSTDPLEIMRANACFSCHVLAGEGTPGVGPVLDGVGSRGTADYIRRSIVDPGAEAAAGFESSLGIMPATVGDLLTARQLEALVGFLSSQR